MKRCPNCSHENNDNMSFCLECGTPLPNAPMVFNLQNDAGHTGSLPGAAPPTNFGANRQTANFANNQPNFTSGYQQPPITPQQIPQRGKSKLPLIIGGVFSLFLLLGFAGAAVVVYNLQSEKKAVVDVTPTPAVSPALKDNKSPSPAPSVSLKGSPNTENPNVSPQASFTPPLEPTKKGSFTVHANTGWQLSDLDVIANEEFTTSVQGMIDLAGIKGSVSSSGVKDPNSKSRRIYQEYPTGALLMRTRYADGKTSNTIAMTTSGANGSWQNFPYEIGKLEFCINDNAPEQNGGQFIVTKTTTPPRAPKRK